MIYSFFDVGPDARKGLGTYIILDHIIRAARAGLPYVYLGYWVRGSKKMDYKSRFRPIEALTREGWERLETALCETVESLRLKGGMGSFRPAAMFFLGLILGEFLAGAIWAHSP